MQPNTTNAEAQANFAELRRRGITDAVIEAFGLHFRTDLPFAFTSGVVIPVRDSDGTLIFNKYRRSYINNDIKQKYAYDIGSRTTLFGIDHLRADHDTVVVTEGEMDALVLWSQNIPAVSSTGGALSFQPEAAMHLVGKKVYLCYDNDDAGAEGLVKTLKLIPDAYVVLIPEVVGVKDISDFVAHGKDFRGLLATARQYLSVAEVEEDRIRRAAQFQPVRFHDAWLNEHVRSSAPAGSRTKRSTHDPEQDGELGKAKAVDCRELLEFNRQHKAVCLWHNDSDPSLHYYEKTNSCYCHSCGKFADAVDIYMAQNPRLSFKEAIKELAAR